jgi:hypothetical protein
MSQDEGLASQADNAQAAQARKRASSPNRPYPRRTLEQALRVAKALRDHNGGQPWESTEVAKSLGLGAKSGNFFYLTSAAKQYGLTEGTSQSAEIALTDLGRRAIYPQSAEDEREALQTAFLNVPTFRGGTGALRRKQPSRRAVSREHAVHEVLTRSDCSRRIRRPPEQEQPLRRHRRQDALGSRPARYAFAGRRHQNHRSPRTRSAGWQRSWRWRCARLFRDHALCRA